MNDLLFHYQYFAANVLVLAMVAVLWSYLGVYVVCKRIVFVGVALAEISAMGIGFAFFVAGWLAARRTYRVPAVLSRCLRHLNRGLR